MVGDIAVIIPTFNRPALLKLAINSVINQTIPVKEILVCDDGSSYEIEELLMNFNDLRIKLIKFGRNGRPAIPRNLGIKSCTSEWISFLDDDDEWVPSKIEKQQSFLANSNIKMICSNAIRKNNKGLNSIYTSFTNSVITRKELIESNYIVCSSVLIHRDLLERAGYFPEELSLKALEDYTLWLKISTFSNVLFLNEPLVIYNDNSEVSLRSESNSTWHQRNKIFHYLIEWCQLNCIDAGILKLFIDEFEKSKRELKPGLFLKVWRWYKTFSF